MDLGYPAPPAPSARPARPIPLAPTKVIGLAAESVIGFDRNR
jgi:hypothetical protein